MEKDYAVNSGRISGGFGWSIQFSTPDCQHGWSVIKEGTGQSIGCYLKEEDARAALEALAVTEPVVNKCMTCGCDDLGNDHHYISETEKCSYCVTKGQGPCWDGYEYAGTKEQDGKTVPNCIPVKKSIWNGAFSPINISKAANPTPTKDSTSIWDGIFVSAGEALSGVNFGSKMGDTGWLSTYNTPPQNDGKPSVGYGNSSSPQGKSNQ